MKPSSTKTIFFMVFLGWFSLSSIIFMPKQARAEASSDLLGRYTCSYIKDKAEKTPEWLFKMWANSGEFGSNSAVATDIIMRGELQGILSHIGDLNTLIQGLEEAVSGDPKKVAAIFADWLLKKALTMTGSGVPGAVWTVCTELNTFAIALNEEILDLNIVTFSRFAEKNPELLGPGRVEYFLNTFMEPDKSAMPFTQLNKKRATFFEYAKVKLGHKNFPSMNEWKDKDNWNMVRSAASSLLHDVEYQMNKRKKFAQLQGQLKTNLDALKKEQGVLLTFKAMRDQVLAMTCLDEASKDCMSVYSSTLSTLQNLTADAGDINATASGVLDDIKSRLSSLYKLLESIDKKVNDDYKTRVEEYCTTATTRLKTLEVTLSTARSANAEIAAQAVRAKGFRERACNATDPVQAKAAADAAGKAANEAFLTLSATPLLPRDLNSYIAPEAIDFAGAQAEMAAIEEQVSSLTNTINENFKKWETFRKTAASARQQLNNFNSTCGKNDVIDGIAAAIMADRFKGKIQQIESQVPDIRYEKNMLDGFSRRLAEIRTFMNALKTRHEKYRGCLSKVPYAGGMASEATALMDKAKSQLELAKGYAGEAKTCLDKFECRSDNDCTDGKICQDGKCVCKAGYEEVDGKCVKECRPGQELDADGNCVPICGPNQEMTASGRCVCIAGYEEIDGKCVKECQPGQEMDADGNCVPVCGPNEERTASGRCVCISGYKRDKNNICKEIGDQCKNDSDCPKGYECNPGTGECVFIPQPQCKNDGDCPKNYVCKNGECVYQKPSGCTSSANCPKGYVCERSTGKCVSPFDGSYASFTGDLTAKDDQRGQSQADQNANDQNTGQSGYSSDDLDKNIANVHGQVSRDCYKNSDCPKDEVCKNGRCVPHQPIPQPPPQPDPATATTDPPPVTPDPATQTANATLTINPANKVITKSESVSFKAVLVKDDGTTEDVTGKASWNPSQTFSNKNLGPHTVTASFNNLSASAGVSVVEEKGLGDITVSEKTITVTFWDHGQEDGDMIDITINGKAVFSGITLTKAPQTRTVTLKAGALVFGFTALNVGRISPNTATVRFSSVVSGKPEQVYSLKKSAQANMNITYTPK